MNYRVRRILFENLIEAPSIENVTSFQRTPPSPPLVHMNKVVIHGGQVTRPSERLASVRSDITGTASTSTTLLGISLSRVNAVADSFGRFPRAQIAICPSASSDLFQRCGRDTGLNVRTASYIDQAERTVLNKLPAHRTRGYEKARNTTPPPIAQRSSGARAAVAVLVSLEGLAINSPYILTLPRIQYIQERV